MTEPPRKSPLREMVEPDHVALGSLEEARADEHGVVVLEGDWGGQIYVVVRASSVRCSEASLRSLLEKLDRECWDEPEGASIVYERRAPGEFISGGMGGALANELWVHPELEGFRSRIEATLRSER